MGWPTLQESHVYDAPQYALEDFRSLPPATVSMVGSGVPLPQVPIFTNPWQEKYESVCGACKSTNTTCIFAETYSDLVGKDDEYELFCLDCGKFTRYHYVE